jgi:hypothetical protein
VRVAARGTKTGRVGSQIQWILIPDLNNKKLTLSSLFIGEQTEDSPAGPIEASSFIEDGISVDRQFATSSKIRCLVFIYNFAQNAKTGIIPELFVQMRILKRGLEVMRSPSQKVTINSLDPSRTPFGADFPLNELSSGRYELQVIVEDRVSKETVEQKVKFQIK